MFLQTVRFLESFSTPLADKPPVIIVPPHVCLHGIQDFESFPTDRTRIILGFVVGQNMGLQALLREKILATNVAQEGGNMKMLLVDVFQDQLLVFGAMRALFALEVAFGGDVEIFGVVLRHVDFERYCEWKLLTTFRARIPV